VQLLQQDVKYPKSTLSTNDKLLIYEATLKPIWTYRIQLWVTASTSNIEILECFQSKTLLMIVDAPLVCAEYG
jgi:hypothetical protein